MWPNSAIKFEYSLDSVSPVARFIQVVKSGTLQPLQLANVLTDIINSQCQWVQEVIDAASAKVIWCLLTTLISLSALACVHDGDKRLWWRAIDRVAKLCNKVRVQPRFCFSCRPVQSSCGVRNFTGHIHQLANTPWYLWYNSQCQWVQEVIWYSKSKDHLVSADYTDITACPKGSER